MKQTLSVELDHEVLSLITNISFSCVPAWYGATMRNLKMNVIAPKVREGHEPCPAIIWICGGAYRVVDNAVWMPEMMYFARKGYVIASIEYRTSNEAAFPAALIDVKSAIRYIKAHAQELCIDPNRICIMGESGGGTMASLAGTTGNCKEFEQGDNLQEDSTVQAVVDFYGITNMLELPVNVGEGVPPWILQDFIGMDYTKEMAEKASAVKYVDEHTPPFLIFHGDKDPLVPIFQSDNMYETLQKQGIASDYYVIEGAGHGEDCFYQERPLKIIEAFLERVLRQK